MRENKWKCSRCGKLVPMPLYECPYCRRYRDDILKNEAERMKCCRKAYLILLFEDRKLLEKSEIIAEMELPGYSPEEIEADLDWLIDNKYLYWFGKKGSLLLSKRGEESLSEFKRLREKRLL